jgi:Mn2+/Fe2+ NRAMP family transporter
VPMTILSQVLNGVLLPFVLYFMLKLINNKALMGKHTNSRWFNVVAWSTAVIVVGLTVVMLWQQMSGMVGAKG